MRCDCKGQDLSGNFKGKGRVRFNSPGTFLLLGLCIYLTPLPVQETQVQSQDQEDPLEMEKATRSTILAWEVP